MSLAAALDPRRLSELADEVDPLLQRLRECALEGIRALEAGNLLDLVRAMQERERVFVRAAPLLDELRTRWTVAKENRRGGGEASRSLDAPIERILHTLHGIQLSDATLMSGVGELQSFTESELSHVRRQRADQFGYAEAKRTGTHLDLRR
jgi:hypothetical protein